QPISAQFIHDSHVLVNNKLQDSVSHQQIMANQNNMFTGQDSFLSQSMNMSSYIINADLIAKTGKLNQPSIYQRLY
ncbi:hypothetical protein R0J93_25830, partial [Pseudoalteromonas sp. SIMBA_148]